MRLKSFYAKTMSEAMQMVKDTLGDDAVIVATREERGGAVHVTAAVEPAFELGRGGIAAGEDDWLQYDAEDEEGAIAEELTETMLRHAVPEDVMDNILSCAAVVGLDGAHNALSAALEHLFQFKPLPLRGAKKPQMFVGPAGSGKTLAVAKLAARGVMDGLKVAVISCDTVRAGGIAQLEAFTNLLKIKLHHAGTPAELKELAERLQTNHDLVLIDSAGTNPYSQDDIKEAARLIGVTDMDVHLVLPAGLDTDESGEMARVFSTLGVHSLLPARLDMARRLGGILAAAHHGNFSFADAGNTPKVADGFLKLSPDSLSRLLLPSTQGALNKDRSTTGSRS